MRPNKPLSGIRILDFTQYLPGPLATKVLADLGAEVIKIEPSEGDFMRNIPPFENKVSLLYKSLNLGKKSLRLNVQTNEGYEILKKLVKKTDVVIHSVRLNRAKKLKITLDDLEKINKKIILCEILPDFDTEAGHDLNFVAESGLLSLILEEVKELPYFQVGDLFGGSFNLVVTLLSALVQRQKIKKAQNIQLSMKEGTRYFLDFYFKSYRKGGGTTLKIVRGMAPCYNVYDCKDGRKIVLAALEPYFWSNVCAVLKRPDLLDKQFDEIYLDEMRKIFKSKKSSEWRKLLKPGETTLSLLEDYKKVKDIKFYPSEFNNQKIEITNKVKELGQDYEEILKDLGYSKVEILRMRSERVV